MYITQELIFGVAQPCGDTEKVLQVVDDIDSLSPDLLAKPDIFTRRYHAHKKNILPIIRTIAKDYKVNKIIINLENWFYEEKIK